jgi:hypothetical protein
LKRVLTTNRIVYTDIKNKKWFAGLDLDELRKKKYRAPFKPNTSTLDTLVEQTTMHPLSDVDVERDTSPCGPPKNSSRPMFGKSSINPSSLLDDSDEE